MFFPRLSYTGFHYTRGKPERKDILDLIQRTARGRFSAAHLWWSEEAAGLFREHSVKHIIMLRDPRDIIISDVFYIMRRKKHHLHNYFASLPDVAARIRAYMTGIPAHHSSKGIAFMNIKERFESYRRWCDEDFNLAIFFEDLIGPRGNSDRSRQLEQIQRISRYVNEPLTEKQRHKVADNLFSTKSVTFRKGSPGAWKEHLTNENKSVFLEITGDLLEKLGYEDGPEW
jgi:hypothetical protein